MNRVDPKLAATLRQPAELVERGLAPAEALADLERVAMSDELAVEIVKVDDGGHGGWRIASAHCHEGRRCQYLGGACCLGMHNTSHEFSLGDYVGCNMFCVLDALFCAAGQDQCVEN